MKKLNLNLDDLAVESFGTTSPKEQGRGTVNGHVTQLGQDSCYNLCSGQLTQIGYDCDGIATNNDPSCAFTCGQVTCHGQSCNDITCRYTCGDEMAGLLCWTLAYCH
ncbi:MAG TPA: hypothetical protein VFJ16_31275 [Longimicrobium sp.]|nr:hypothetical protein [Longimicrobium sp.]